MRIQFANNYDLSKFVKKCIIVNSCAHKDSYYTLIDDVKIIGSFNCVEITDVGKSIDDIKQILSKYGIKYNWINQF